MTWWMDFLNSKHAVGSASAAQDTNGEVGNEDELISAPDFLHDNDDENDAETSNFEMEMSDDEADVREEMPYGKGATSALFQGKGPRYLSSLTQIAQGYKRYSSVPHLEGCSADRLIIRRKGAWTREEDTLLKRCVETFGEGNRHLVPAIAGLNRCRKSCRLRWTNSLKPAMKRGEFEDDEMDLIFRLHKLLGSRQY